MLIGQSVFNADTMNELVRKIENGSYNVPTSVSKEVVSFLNGMLQYDGNNRLSAAELSKSPFLTKRVSDFTKIDTRRVSRKINNKGLNINVKKNQTIWAIFNEEDEKKLVNIRGGRDLPVPMIHLLIQIKGDILIQIYLEILKIINNNFTIILIIIKGVLLIIKSLMV